MCVFVCVCALECVFPLQRHLVLRRSRARAGRRVQRAHVQDHGLHDIAPAVTISHAVCVLLQLGSYEQKEPFSLSAF